MYTVVVCSECQCVWIVNGRPERSKCRRCGKNRLFKKLKKYSQHEDAEVAKLARAKTQAVIDDQKEHFERAFERGVLQEEIDQAINDDEYLSGLGLDADEIENAAEEILESPRERNSEKKIVRKAVKDQGSPTIDDVLDYAKEYELSESKAILCLERILRSGDLSPPENISLQSVEAVSESILAVKNQSDTSKGKLSSEEQQHRSSSLQNNILSAVRASDPPSIDNIADSIEGPNKKRILLALERLCREGKLPDDLSFSLEDIELAIEDQLDTNSERTTTEHESSQGSSSQKEVIENAVVDQESPDLDDVLAYTQTRGLDRETTVEGLEKLVRSGQVHPSNIGHSEIKNQLPVAEKKGTDNGNPEASSLSSRSKPEIIVERVETQPSPTKEEIIQYAAKQGIGEKKAEQYLRRLIDHGKLSERPDGTLRAL